jgi:hypothetical protein
VRRAAIGNSLWLAWWIACAGCGGDGHDADGSRNDGDGAAVDGGTTGNVTAPEEHPAINEAKAIDDGSGLVPGGSREVQTANGVVIVAKDSTGSVQYRLK